MYMCVMFYDTYTHSIDIYEASKAYSKHTIKCIKLMRVLVIFFQVKVIEKNLKS